VLLLKSIGIGVGVPINLGGAIILAVTSPEYLALALLALLGIVVGVSYYRSKKED
jgi:xanthosine utilization system XapX-like protein